MSHGTVCAVIVQEYGAILAWPHDDAQIQDVKEKCRLMAGLPDVVGNGMELK